MCLFHKMPPFGGAFAQQRPILTPIGELLPVEGACVTGFPSCRINHAEHSAELAATRPPPIRLRRTPPKGKRLTTFCASLSLLQNVFAVHPRESVSRDFRVAIAPLQITFACHPIQGGEWTSLRFPVELCNTLLSVHSAP